MNNRKEITIDESKEIQLNLLQNVMTFCKENKIRCWLCGGTLLGAIRHHGFIPWDDDIDLEMPREDYIRFLKLFHGKNNIKIISIENNSHYYQVFAKIYDSRTCLIENINHACKIGVCLDIFPLDNLTDDFEDCKKLAGRLSFWQKILKFKLIKLSKNRPLSRNILIAIGKLFSIVFSVRYIIKKIDVLTQTFSYNKESVYVGALATQTYGLREIMKREWFQEDIEVKFEGAMYPAPAGYHNILSQMYGDYMIPPPENKRKSHHDYIAYWKE